LLSVNFLQIQSQDDYMSLIYTLYLCPQKVLEQSIIKTVASGGAPIL